MLNKSIVSNEAPQTVPRTNLLSHTASSDPSDAPSPKLPEEPYPPWRTMRAAINGREQRKSHGEMGTTVESRVVWN